MSFDSVEEYLSSLNAEGKHYVKLFIDFMDKENVWKAFQIRNGLL